MCLVGLMREELETVGSFSFFMWGIHIPPFCYIRKYPRQLATINMYKDTIIKSNNETRLHKIQQQLHQEIRETRKKANKVANENGKQ